jgi:hypothetical protein
VTPDELPVRIDNAIRQLGSPFIYSSVEEAEMMCARAILRPFFLSRLQRPRQRERYRALIGKESLRAWLVAHPGSAIALLTHASLRIRDLSDELRASMSSAYERVARFIEQVAVLEPSSGERIVHAMPATSHIARMLGISRERTSNILNELTRGGYIESRGRSLLVRRPLPESY